MLLLLFTGGFGSYLLGMDQKTHDQVVSTSATSGAPVIELPGNQLVKNPALGWMIGFLITVSFLGIFSIVALRKVPPPPCIYRNYVVVACVVDKEHIDS